MPTDDFVKHFGVCQQIMQRRMSLRGDLPHSVVDVLSEPSLDWLIEASLPLPDASWQSAGILQLSGSLAAAMDFPRYRCLLPLKRGKPAYKYPPATCLRSHFQLQAPLSHKTAAPVTCMSKASSTSWPSLAGLTLRLCCRAPSARLHPLSP